MPLFTRERIINGLIIAAVLLVVFCIAGCAGSRPGMPERVGGLLGAKVEDGPCLYTDTIIIFFKDATSPEGVGVPVGRGCRCAYKVAGVEYFPTQAFPNEMCEAYKVKRLKEQSEANEREQSGSESGTTEPNSTPAEPTSYGL